MFLGKFITAHLERESFSLLAKLNFLNNIFLPKIVYIQENLRMTFFSHLHQIFYRIRPSLHTTAYSATGHAIIIAKAAFHGRWSSCKRRSIKLTEYIFITAHFNSSLHILCITARQCTLKQALLSGFLHFLQCFTGAVPHINDEEAMELQPFTSFSHLSA